jgi:hypothetical protein
MARLVIAVSALLVGTAVASAGDELVLSREELRDRIRGGMLGQMLGNLNGLPHEFDYIDEPGDVRGYEPGLPEGARTDDDTDIEWVFIKAMAEREELFLPPEEVVRLWRAHINDWIWSANNYARQLMELEIEPPHTGSSLLNPWASFNVGGQFLIETPSLACLGRPELASRLGIHYASVGVDGEPLQATQLFATMIALAPTEKDPRRLTRLGLDAVDPESEVAEIVGLVLKLHEQHPNDWRTPRRIVRDRYTRFDGHRPDINGYPLNTAATLLALLYGEGDFIRTMELAFSIGWDADNSAAMCGTIVGVWRGGGWFDAQGWEIADRYVNDRRPGMPTDETITRFVNRVVKVAELALAEFQNESRGYRIPIGEPTNVRELRSEKEQREALEDAYPDLERDLTAGTEREIARAVYLAVLLGRGEELQKKHPRRWQWGINRIERHAPGLVVALYKSPRPDGERLRDLFAEAGLLRPRT